MGRVLSFYVLSLALKASIIVWSFSLDFFSLSLLFPYFFEAKCVITTLFFVDIISRHARQNNLKNNLWLIVLLLDIAESDHLFFLLFFFLYHSSLSLIFSTYWWQSTLSSYLCLGWLTSTDFSSMNTWMTPSWNECDGLVKCKKKCSRSQMMPKKVLALSVRAWTRRRAIHRLLDAVWY